MMRDPDTVQSHGENLVFIVGCPRSGTTWLQRLLASHPNVQTGEESYLFGYLEGIRGLYRSHEESGRQGDPIGMPAYLGQEEWDHASRRILDILMEPMLTALEPGQIFVEKTPNHFEHLPTIAFFFPRAKAICIHRDPRDVAVSMIAASRSWGKHWAPHTATSAARRWRRSALSVERHATQLPPGFLREVRYEDLLADPCGQVRAIADFLGWKWSIEEIQAAVGKNTADKIRSGEGTPIPLRAVKTATRESPVRLRNDFLRVAGAGAWKTELHLGQRLAIAFIVERFFAKHGYRLESAPERLAAKLGGLYRSLGFRGSVRR